MDMAYKLVASALSVAETTPDLPQDPYAELVDLEKPSLQKVEI